VGRRGAREASPRTLGFKRTVCGTAGKVALDTLPESSMHVIELFGGVGHSYSRPKDTTRLYYIGCRARVVTLLVGPRGRYFEMFADVRLPKSRSISYNGEAETYIGSRSNLEPFRFGGIAGTEGRKTQEGSFFPKTSIKAFSDMERVQSAWQRRKSTLIPTMDHVWPSNYVMVKYE